MKKWFHLTYYFILAMYLELLLRLGIGLSSSWGVLWITGFSLAYGLICLLFEQLWPKRFQVGFRIALTAVACMVFEAQFIYYRFFQTFFTLYSLSKSGQIMEFIPDILYILRTNIHFVLLFLLPLIGFIISKPKPLDFPIPLRKLLLLFFGIVILTYSGLNIMRDVTNNPKNMYYSNRELVNGIRQLGLLTTMRLDIQRWAGIQMDVSTPPMEKAESPSAGEYNQLPLEFTDTPEWQELNEYFSQRLATRKNRHTGRLRGYNVITIIGESFSDQALHPEVTPTLYRLANEGVVFENFYNPLWGVSTIDGEYANLTGLLPVAGMWALYESAENAMPFVPGNMLGKAGYHCYSFHNHDYHYYGRDQIHPNLGYRFIAKGYGLDIDDTWPESDIEMFEQSLDYFTDDRPFHVNYLTVSGHMLYRFGGNAMADKHRDVVESLDYSEEAKAYLAGQVELDRGVALLLKALENKDLLDNTLIVLAGDHHPYGLSHRAYEELAGRRLDKRREIYESSLIMYAPGLGHEVVTKPCSNIDIVPTLYNLLGLDYDSRMFMGSDIFSDAKALVMFQDRSFVVEEGFYDAVKHRFYANVGAIDQQSLQAYREEVDRRFYYSEQIIRSDYFRNFEE